MLAIYRRHRPCCKLFDDRISKKCRCPLWATNTLYGKPYRRSLKTRNWERAQQVVKEIEDGKRGEVPITIEEATEAFITDC